MSDIFIAHVAEDHDIALEVALQLEQAGYRTWIDDLDSTYGRWYKTEIIRAISACKAEVLIISRDSLGSNQVNSEVEAAFGKSLEFITILRGITDEEYKRLKPNWDYMIGGRTSAPFPPEGVEGIIGGVIKGLKSSGIQPRKPDAERISRIRKDLDELQGHAPSEAKPIEEAKKVKSKRPLIIILAAVIVTAAVVAAVPFLTGVFESKDRAPGGELSTTTTFTNNTPTEANYTELEIVGYDGNVIFLSDPYIYYPSGGYGPLNVTEGIEVRYGAGESTLLWSNLRMLRFQSTQEENDNGTIVWRHVVEATLANGNIVNMELVDDWNMAYGGGGGTGLLFGQSNVGETEIPFSNISVLKVLKYTAPENG